MKPTREEEKELGQIADNLNDCGSKKGYRREYFYQELLRVYKMGYDQRKNKDNWRGPDERPELVQDIFFYLPENMHGQFAYRCYGTFQGATVDVDGSPLPWTKEFVACWCPADPGPMPERFKLKGETTK